VCVKEIMKVTCEWVDPNQFVHLHYASLGDSSTDVMHV
jgi:hypothetical protein